ncbi:hypothetical protein HS088_TW21G01373 [Tripterygium wilfordii]|uniref:Protein kinase domain-containing protein n=1 Tax=Tripterygium wilfordii TaxID=458696 RepID=A0A7J7C516_TRIWF|nr:dual specificity protein kinase splB-like [Tripterygium wilfordii]KAF5729214.1 hypothetical protein HS088_TW21G01373 [Tripterygium wilfordii]
MERNMGKGPIDQQKSYEQVQYSNVDTENGVAGSGNQSFFHDPSRNINTNSRPPDYPMSVRARPVLNYSIQTGEEFALEFMRERVNPRQHVFPNAYVDPSTPAGYMDLKNMLGISHTGSESGSDISKVNPAEKERIQEFEKKSVSALDNNSCQDTMRAVPPSSSRNDSNRGLLGYASSSASDSSSTKAKFLCSFGGKILPRPSDGKLRYVGGETRIIRLSKDISWQDLLQKMSAIYVQTHTIKYQLPGEDLDALVSVSCDEDLQNMMEECNVLEHGGSHKPRMFLFSSSELEDAQFGLGSVEGDSEIQYVVAVNGMDLGSRKNSIAASVSGNNLDELLNLSVERETGQVASELASAAITSAAVDVPPATNQSSQQVLANSTGLCESNLHHHLGQNMHHGEAGQHPLYTFHPVESSAPIDGNSMTTSPAIPQQYGYGSRPTNYAVSGENISSMPLYEHLTQQGDVIGGSKYTGFHLQQSNISTKESKLRRDGSAQKINEAEKIQSLEKEVPLMELKMKRDGSQPKINETVTSEGENIASSNPGDASVLNNISREDTSVSNLGPDIESPFLSNKNNKRHQELAQNAVLHEDVNEGRKNNDIDTFYSSSAACAPVYGGSDTDPVDSHVEPSVVPQRVFHSERIPREQAELNRLSKSDDSFGSQFLITQALSDYSQPDTESVDQFRDGNVASYSEQSITSAKPAHANLQTVEEGLAQFKRYKEFADNMSKTKSDVSDVLEATLQKPESRYVIPNGDGPEMAISKNTNTSCSSNDKELAGFNHPTQMQGTPNKHVEDAMLKRPEFESSEITSSKHTRNNAKGHAQPLVLAENPIRAVPQGESAVNVGTPEQGDILIDINDRFPSDFLSDIFSKAKLSENLSGISPLHADGTGLSLNMENHEPKRWSYFRKLAQDEFVRKDVSLMDQDHLGFSSPVTNIEGLNIDYSYPPVTSEGGAFSHVDSHVNFGENIRPELSGIGGLTTIDYNQSQPKGSESVQLDGVNPRIPESEYEDGRLHIENTTAPIIDLPLGEFDISTLQIIENEDLEELRELGSGTFGTVYHGKWRGTDVAIKRIKKSCFTGRTSEQERLTVEFWREAGILSKLHHPNVVAFYGVVQDGPGGTLATVTEFMVNGSLRRVLLSKERYLDRRKRLIIAMDAAFGMEYLHSKNIVHFDLKCDNLLVNLKDSLRPICKVGDFGLSKIKRNTLVTGGVRGTLPWMAPELLNGGSSMVSEKVDVFSFGIVLWEILTGEEPYSNMHYGAIIGGIVNNTLRPLVPSFCDPEWKLLMEQCWAPDPIARPSFTEIARRLRTMSAACQTKPQGQHPPNQPPK